MYIAKISASAESNWRTCEMQYYLSYVLNFRGDPGLAAHLGTTVHKIMEILALAKLEYQKTQDRLILIKDKIIGQYEFDTKKWFSNEEFKVARTTYKLTDKKSVDDIHSLAFNYYKNLYSQHDWSDEDRIKTLRWVYAILSEKEGLYDPRNREIVQPEQYLSYKIPEAWATYDFNDGVKDQLVLNGIVDLITKTKNGYEIIDWKTGQRKDWATGKVKGYEELQSDPQLMFYYYLLTKLFPQYENLILTIFFVKDGGPFSIQFEPEDIPRTEEIIKKTFEEIKNCTQPKMLDPTQKSFKCQRFCAFSQIELDGTNMCRAVGNRIKLQGIEQVTQDLRRK